MRRAHTKKNRSPNGLESFKPSIQNNGGLIVNTMQKNGIPVSFRSVLKKYGILFVLLLIVIIISLLRPEFLTSRNIFNILNQTAIFGIMAIGLQSEILL